MWKIHRDWNMLDMIMAGKRTPFLWLEFLPWFAGKKLGTTNWSSSPKKTRYITKIGTCILEPCRKPTLKFMHEPHKRTKPFEIGFCWLILLLGLRNKNELKIFFVLLLKQSPKRTGLGHRPHRPTPRRRPRRRRGRRQRRGPPRGGAGGRRAAATAAGCVGRPSQGAFSLFLV